MFQLFSFSGRPSQPYLIFVSKTGLEVRKTTNLTLPGTYPIDFKLGVILNSNVTKFELVQ